MGLQNLYIKASEYFIKLQLISLASFKEGV